jgi:glycosyltransferase involved in cell wall biosynthesis
MHHRNERFQRSIPDTSVSAASAVIGFDTASWILLEKCAARAVPFILDQTTPHPAAKLAAYRLVFEQYPDWSDAAELRCAEVRAVEQKEHEGATSIVAGSSFVQQSLVSQGISHEKIRVNPYGVNCDNFRISHRSKASPLRFIFVGGVNGRKGVPLLLDAWRKLRPSNAELWIVGPSAASRQSLLPELRGVKYFGCVSHKLVAELLQQCNVFVFPTYFEGLALVILEAMASGLPVITTTASGGQDVISADAGWLIEPGDQDGLSERLNYCLEHPQIVQEMGRQARAAAEQFTWEAYGDRWMRILLEACN